MYSRTNPIAYSEKSKAVYNQLLILYPICMWCAGMFSFIFIANVFVKLIFVLIAVFIYFKIPKRNREFFKIEKEDEMKSIYNFSKRAKQRQKVLKILAYILVIICMLDFVVGTGYFTAVLPIFSLMIAVSIEMKNIYVGKEYVRVATVYTPISEIIKAEKIVSKKSIEYRLTFKGYLDSSLAFKKKDLAEEAESLLDERLSAVEKKRNTGFW